MTRSKDDSSSRSQRSVRARSNSSASSSAVSSNNAAPAAAHFSPELLSSSPSLSPLLSSPSSRPSSPSYGFKSSSSLHAMFAPSASLREAELQLEDAIRLCDTREYCDTMMIAASLLSQQSGRTFLSVMDALSSRRFLSSPCYAAADASTRRRGWTWDIPAWFRAVGFFSFATFVASKLEMGLWMRFWEAKGGDGRRGGGGLVRERLSSKQPLEVFWAGLGRDRREKVWSRVLAVVEAARRRDDTDDSRSVNSETTTSTSLSTATHDAAEAADWQEEEKQSCGCCSPSAVVSPLEQPSPSSARSQSQSRSRPFNPQQLSAHHHHGDINSAPISSPHSRGRSVSPPASRRKPSLPMPASAPHAAVAPPSSTSTASSSSSTSSASSSFPFSAPLRHQPRQISIPSSTASLSSGPSSPMQPSSPSSSSSSVPSRAHTPPPHHHHNRSSSALSASSTPSSFPSSSSSSSSSHRKRAAAAASRKERRKAEHREKARQRKTSSWDGGSPAAAAASGRTAESWDDASSSHSFDSGIAVRDSHDYQRGVDQLLRLVKAMQAASRGERQDDAAAAGGRERKGPTTPTARQRLMHNGEPEEAEVSRLSPTRLNRSSSGSQQPSSFSSSSSSRAVELSASQPLSSSLSFSSPSLWTSLSPSAPPHPPSRPEELPPLFLHSSSSSSSSSSSASSSSPPSSGPSLTLTLAELRSAPPSSVPLPSPSSLPYQELIDFLFFSPLPRAHTSLDLIIRRMGIAVQSLYAETMGIDLILGEEAEDADGKEQTAAGGAAEGRRSKAARKKKKAKKRRAKEEAGAAAASGLQRKVADDAAHKAEQKDRPEREREQGGTAAETDCAQAQQQAEPQQAEEEVGRRQARQQLRAEEEEDSERKQAEADSSEHSSSSSGDDDSRGRKGEEEEEDWTEVVGEERRRDERRRQRKRSAMTAAARAKDDFFTSSSSSSSMHSSASPSLYSRAASSSSHAASSSLSAFPSARLPPRSPIRAKDDIFTDRVPRVSQAGYGLTSLPLSRGVSILAGSPSPASWAKVAYHNSSRSSSAALATPAAAAGAAATGGGSGVWWPQVATSTSSSGGSSSSSGASLSAPSSPLISSSPTLLQAPMGLSKRAASSGAVPAVDLTQLSEASAPAVQPVATAAPPPVPSPPPALSALSWQKQPSLCIPPEPIAPVIPSTSPSSSVAVSPSSSPPLPSLGPSPSLPPSPPSERKLSTLELIALHERNVKPAATAAASTEQQTAAVVLQQHTAGSQPDAQEAVWTDGSMLPPAVGQRHPRLSSLPLQSDAAAVSSASRSHSLIPSREEMRAAIAQAQQEQMAAGGSAASGLAAGAGGLSFRPQHIPSSAWHRAQQFWQEQQRLLSTQQQHRSQLVMQRQHRDAAQVQAQQADAAMEPQPQPQLRTYIRGPVMSLPPQHRGDSASFSSSSPVLPSPPLTDGLQQRHLERARSGSGSRPAAASPASTSSQQLSVAAMIRAYERARHMESMSSVRGWERPALLVGSSGFSHSHALSAATGSSPSSPSCPQPLEFSQPHSAPLVPHPQLAGPRFSPLLLDQPLRGRHSRRSDGYDGRSQQQRRSADGSEGDTAMSAVPSDCPPWLTAESLPLFSSHPQQPSPSSASSSCSYCQEIAEKARAGAIAPGRVRELPRLHARDAGELTPQQAALLFARSSGVDGIMQAQRTAKPTVQPNFILTPAIYPAGHPLVPVLPASAVAQLQMKDATSAPPSALLFHHHHHGAQAEPQLLPDSLRLHREMELFTAYVSHLAARRHPLLQLLMARVRETVLSLWPSALVHSYGSFMTGLGLPSSDLDLVLLRVPVEAKQALPLLASVLKAQQGWVVSLHAIDTARMPVIKVVGSVQGQQLVVDITFDQQNGDALTEAALPSSLSVAADCAPPPAPAAMVSSLPPLAPPLSSPPSPVLHSGLASVELICHYVAVFPPLRPLTLVLKQFLYERGLSSTYTGGLNSYCLVLMLVAFLQSRPQPYRHYAQHQQAVHDAIATQRRRQRQLVEQMIDTQLPEPPLPRPASVPALLASHSSAAPAASLHRPSFTLNAQSAVFQPAASLSARSVPSSPLPDSSPAALSCEGGANDASAALFCSELSSLQRPLAPGEDDLGRLLLQTLEWYGQSFDFSSMGIAVSPPPTLPHLPAPQLGLVQPVSTTALAAAPTASPSSASASPASPALPPCFFYLPCASSTLVLSDPLYPLLLHNIGQSVFGIQRIRQAMEDGLQRMRGDRAGAAAAANTMLSRLISGPAMPNALPG